MDLIDLHTHSNYSDGTMSPKELIEYAGKKGLKAVALTDHDTVLGLQEAEAAAQKAGVELVKGVEISASYEDYEIHILGLLIDDRNPAFLNSLAEMERRRIKRNLEIIELFKEENIDLDFSDILESKERIITRMHFARLLVESNYAESYAEAFLKYLAPGRKAYKKRELFTAKEALEMIHSAGGVSSLAHPGEYKMSLRQVEDMAFSLKKQGLGAIEAYYSANTLEEERFYIGLAKRYNLKITGGSDFHGKNRPKADLGVGYGNLRIPYYVLSGLKGN